MQKQYLKVFEQIKPHLDYMRTNALRFCHYKGWADIDSPMLYEPDILFIGINMGPGRYRNFGCLPPDFPTPWRSTLHYIKDGVARDKEWWNTSNGRIPKNLFPATICELLEYIGITRLSKVLKEKNCQMCFSRELWQQIYTLLLQKTKHN